MLDLLGSLDWVAAVFTISGNLALQKKRRIGWVVLSIGSALWVVVAALGRFSGRPIYAQVLLSLVSIIISVRAYFIWGKDAGR